MFLGEVLGVRDLKSTDSPYSVFLSRAYRFRVIESFAGGQRNGEEVEVRTGHGGGDCGYTFVVGQRYLVDAYASPASTSGASLSTGICSATAPEDFAQIALTELRARAAGQRVPDLNGQILNMEEFGQVRPGGSRTFPSVPVTLTEQPEGMTYRANTDDAGVYTFSSVPPGNYRVSFALPPTLAAREEEDGKPLLVTIPANDGAGASCHLSIHAAPSGTIAGQIVDAAGNGLKGFVAAYPATQADSRNWAAAASTDEGGRFQLDFLRDGSYRLEFSADVLALRRFNAKATVEAGQATAGLRLVVP